MIKLSPELASPHINIGKILYSVYQNFEASFKEFKEAVRITKYSISLFGLANAHKKLGNINEAKKEYEEALSYRSNHFLALVSLGHLQLLSHNMKEAKKLLKKALNIIENDQA